jgi:hypothetical protein
VNTVVKLPCPRKAEHSWLFFVSPRNIHDAHRGEGQSTSALHTIGGRAVRTCELCAHAQETVPLFNILFSVAYWTRNYADHCIMFVKIFINLLIPLLK